VPFEIGVTPTAPTAASTTTVTVTSSTPQDDPDTLPDTRQIVQTLVAQPTLTAQAATVVEGNSGTLSASIPLTLSAPTSKRVTVRYVSGAWTATSGDDYLDTQGTATFEPGQTRSNVDVVVKGDTLDEPDTEAVLVALVDATNAVLRQPDAVYGAMWTGVVIQDDDAPPVVVPGSRSQAEGASPTIAVPIALSAPSGRTVTVDWTTADYQATAPDDYTAASGRVTFAPGETTKDVTVAVRDDRVVEPDEMFVVWCKKATNATIGGIWGLGFALLRNDD
jgi:chitinase